MDRCPICGALGAPKQLTGGDSFWYSCQRCGQFCLTGSASVLLPRFVDQGAINATLLSHVLRVQFDATQKPRNLFEEDLKPFLEDKSFIRPQEQFNKLILWIGQNQTASNEWTPPATMSATAARIGAAINRINNTEPGVSWLFQAFGLTYFVHQNALNGSALEYRLTAPGWTYFDELSRRVVNSRNAFMAMKFNDAQLDGVLKTCFQPAALRAGFTLRPLNALPAAGLIDNQIRAAIRSARFVVADLTHDNDGAYFEAGFAEGLGIPVIYTCEVTKFKAHKTHFDTNHMTTIVWDAGNLDKASGELTATIRNTLPVDAKPDD